MAISEAKRASNDRWDKENMAYQTVKVSKALLQEFREEVASRGERVNTVLREAMENYIDGNTLQRAQPIGQNTLQPAEPFTPELIKAAEEAAQAVGEPVGEFLARAIKTTAERDRLTAMLKRQK